MDDRGIVLLLGARFAEQQYRDAMPEGWLREAIVTDDPLEALRELWREH